jgi:hypothetical protein
MPWRLYDKRGSEVIPLLTRLVGHRNLAWFADESTGMKKLFARTVALRLFCVGWASAAPRRWASNNAEATLPSACQRRPASTFGSVRHPPSVRLFHFGLSKVNGLEVSHEITAIHPYDTTNADLEKDRGTASNLKGSYRNRNQMSGSQAKE